MDESMADDSIKTFSPLLPETSTVADQCETEETEGGGEKTKFEANAYDEEIAEKMAMRETTEDDNTEDFCPLIIGTLAVVSENQRETGETGGGSKECKTRSGSERKMIRPEFRSKRKLKQAEVDLYKIREFYVDGNHSYQNPIKRAIWKEVPEVKPVETSENKEKRAKPDGN